MTTKDEGGPAFPIPRVNDPDGRWVSGDEPGMSLRDYFAAKAMASMLHFEFGKDGFATMATVSKDAYRMADAMLSQRDK